MTDTIKRWECVRCGRKLGSRFHAGHAGPGRLSKTWCEAAEPVERTYIAVDALMVDATVIAAQKAYDRAEPPQTDWMLEAIRAAIAAVTGEQET